MTNRSAARVYLGEAKTPLVASEHARRDLGLRRVFFKLENCNPSGSYKDRFVAAEVQRLLQRGRRSCIATSSGNTGSSLASYCARYDIRCVIVVNEAAPAGKLMQMQAHGACIFRVKAFGTSPEVTESVFQCLSRISQECSSPLVVSAFRHCPEGMAGVESIADELRRQRRRVHHHVFVPVGGGGLFSAICRGFERQGGTCPRVHAVQSKGCSTVVAAFERGDNEIRPVESTTRVSGLAVPFDIDASLALRYLRQFGGQGFAVEDSEIFDAQRWLLKEEGIFAEPAGATALAGLRKAAEQGIVGKNETAICLVTGHGFKDPDSIRKAAAENLPVLIDFKNLEPTLMGVVA